MSESIAQTPAPGAADVLSPGALLGAARRAQNLSVEDAARQLRLSVQQVQALEADAHDQLPAPVFVRGFIRNYARLLRIDPGALLPPVETAPAVPDKRVVVSLTAGVPFPSPRRPRRLPYFAIVALMLIAGLAWYEFYASHRVEGPRERVAPATTSTDVALAVAGPAASTVESPAAGSAASPISAAVANPIVPAVAVAAPAVRSEGTLQFSFAAPSWLEVRDAAGSTLVSATQPVGTQRTLKGVPPFALVVGNAQSVRLTYNDKPVDLAPHVVNSVARMRLE